MASKVSELSLFEFNQLKRLFKKYDVLNGLKVESLWIKELADADVPLNNKSSKTTGKTTHIAVTSKSKEFFKEYVNSDSNVPTKIKLLSNNSINEAMIGIWLNKKTNQQDQIGLSKMSKVDSENFAIERSNYYKGDYIISFKSSGNLYFKFISKSSMPPFDLRSLVYSGNSKRDDSINENSMVVPTLYATLDGCNTRDKVRTWLIEALGLSKNAIEEMADYDSGRKNKLDHAISYSRSILQWNGIIEIERNGGLSELTHSDSNYLKNLYHYSQFEKRPKAKTKPKESNKVINKKTVSKIVDKIITGEINDIKISQRLISNEKLVESTKRHEETINVILGYASDMGIKLYYDNKRDIYFTTSSGDVIIEVKTTNESNIKGQTRKAIVQLLEYEHYFGKAKKIALFTDGKLSDEYNEFALNHIDEIVYLREADKIKDILKG